MLDDHKRKGKIFKPPLLSLGTFIDTGWLDYSVPEFIWILLLIEDYGVNEGSRLSLEFSIISDLYITPKVNNPSAPSIISFFNLLSSSDKSNLLNDMNKKSILKKIGKTFTPFIELYPECPLSFIVDNDKPKEINSKDEYLSNYKKDLKKFFEKTGFESSIVLANVMGFMASVDRIKITKNSSIPDLNEIFKYPHTEESKHLASFLRSTATMCFSVGSYDRKNPWIQYFWNQSLKIEPCQL